VCRKRNAVFLEQLQLQIDNYPAMSMRNLASRLEVDVHTIHIAIFEDLRYTSYVLKV
jgi:hypothetical protein